MFVGDRPSITEYAEGFEALMDESGALPGDVDYVEPEGTEGTPDAEADVADAFEGELEQEEADETEGGEAEESEADEGEGEEVEGAETSEAEETEPEQLFDITLDGEEYEVNLAELQAGYIRNEDFVKRSTSLESEHAQRMAELERRESDLVREIEATSIAVYSDLKEYENLDWSALKASDPAKYQEKRLEYIERKEKVQGQLQRRSQIQAMQQKAAEIKQKAYLQEQLVLAEKLVPEFKDEGYRASIVKYAESIGITADEVMGITDARHLLLLDQARRYSEAQLRKKEVAEKKLVAKQLPAVVKPSAKAPVASVETKRQKALEAQFAKTGSIADAALAFEAFI